MNFSNAIIDLIEYPDVISLSRTIGSVKGGGLIFIFMPFSYLSSHKYLEKLKPVGINQLPRDILRRRLLLKAFSMEGIYVYSSYSDSFIYSRARTVAERSSVYDEIVLPNKYRFPRELYDICITQDQIDTLKSLEQIDSMSHILITADRGRGKSSVIGIGLTGLAIISEDRLNIIVTSPEKENVIKVFEFLKRSHEIMDIKYSFDERSLLFKSNVIKAIYKTPFEALHGDADLLVVDEAAGLPLPLLARLLDEFSKIIFSTTIHGYEGTGRTFSVRFISLLKQKDPSFIWIKLKKPIRYSEQDTVEKWLFDALQLNAEPKNVSRDYINSKVNLTRLTEHNPMNLAFNDEKLGSIFGILVTAHYRNNPNDLLMLCDAPHHKVLSLELEGNPLAALQISMEGGIPDDSIQVFYNESPSSHIIPDKLFKYYGAINFLQLKGWRIVRIATHPNLMRMGLGSRALRLLESKAMEENIAWIGAGFSAYPELLKFWVKNGFVPVHISPKVNKKTGEHTVMVVKPLNSETVRIISEINANLKLRLLRESSSTFRNLDSNSLRIILKSGLPIEEYNLRIDSMSAFRLNLYLKEVLHFESASDVVEELIRYYFAKQLKLFSEKNEILLLSAVLQRKRVGLDNLLKVRKLITNLWEYISTSAT